MIPAETDAEYRARIVTECEPWARLWGIGQDAEHATGEELDRLGHSVRITRLPEVPDLGIVPSTEHRYPDLVEIDICAEDVDVLDVCIGETVSDNMPPRGVELNREHVEQIVNVMQAWLVRARAAKTS